MKKIALIILCYCTFLFQYTTNNQAHAQDCFLINGSSVKPSYCLSELPFVLTELTAGGTFSGLGILTDPVTGDILFNPAPTELGTISNNFTISYANPSVTDCVNSFKIVRIEIPDQEAKITAIPFFCSNSDTTLNLADIGNIGSQGSFLVEGQVTTTFTPTQFGEGTYDLLYSYFDPNTGCPSIDSTKIIVSAPPDVTFEAPAQMCISDGEIAFTIPSGFVGTFVGDGVAVDRQTFDPSIAGLGTHRIVHSYCDLPNVCCNDYSLTIEVLPEPSIGFAAKGSACFTDNDTIIYTGDVLPETASYNWTIEDGQRIYDGGDTLVVSWSSAGEKLVSLEITNAICAGSLTISDRIVAQGIDLTVSEEQFIKIDESVELSAEGASNPTGEAVNYSWFPPVSLNCTECPNPIANPTETTTYAVTATNLSGCSITDSVTVNVLLSRDVFIPNIFTPNEDGRNDNFTIYGNGIANMTLTVFDRWGGRIFETNDMANGWDGTAKGRNVDSGVYVYMAEISFVDENIEPVIKTGSITLVR